MDTDPVAFLSYVRADDEHDHGKITSLRSRLEGEVRMQTGRRFRMFQDKKDILWGQNWKERLEKTILNVNFPIPVITPSYFASQPCREEFDQFLIREKQLGEDTLILPIYYVSCDELDNNALDDTDPIARVLSLRNWSDWRDLRFKDIVSNDVSQHVAAMARTIKAAMKNIEAVIAASRIIPTPPSAPIEQSQLVTAVTYLDIVPEFHDLSPKVRSKNAEPYRAYTKSFDEVVYAATLSTQDELSRLQDITSAARHRFSAALQRAIKKNPNDFHISTVQDDISISILLDNSGSMRGKKIHDCVAWMFVICKFLEIARIPFEILGYTTRTWKGGQSRERWLLDKKPENPGRLNDIRHIIYKDFAQSVLSSSIYLNLMMREGLLKENIDGEALLWVYHRAIQYDRPRKVIIVLSDGAPVDDYTLSVSPGQYLERHLVSVIGLITRRDDFSLLGVGVDFDANRYYPDSISVKDTEFLGVELLRKLQERFKD